MVVTPGQKAGIVSTVDTVKTVVDTVSNTKAVLSSGIGSTTSSYGKLDQFTESLPFIVFFLIMVLMISMSFGQKALTGFLIVMLVSMVLFNQGELETLFSYIKV